MSFRTLGPEPSASANSATWALIKMFEQFTKKSIWLSIIKKSKK